MSLTCLGRSRLVATAVAVMLLAPLHAQVASLDLAAALSKYESGDVDGAMRIAASIEDLALVLRDLPTASPAWINAVAENARPRRRLVAATFMLDLAVRPRDVSTTQASARYVLAQSRRQLVMLAGAMLTMRAPELVREESDASLSSRRLKLPRVDLPVQPGERAWFLAATALLEQEGVEGLVDLPRSIGTSAGTYPLLALALKRFPGDEAFRLATANAQSFWGAPFTKGLAPAVRDTRDPEELYQLSNAAPFDPRLDRRQLLRDALRTYSALAASSAIGQESAVRAGYVATILGETKQALEHFDDVQPSRASPEVFYVSRILKGWTLERLQRLTEAESAYRSAIAAIPSSRSAPILLAEVLVLQGRGADTADLTPAFFRDATDDPWARFLKLSAPRLDALMAAARTSLR